MTIQIQGLGKSFGPRTLFEDVSIQLVPGSRYGLVGANDLPRPWIWMVTVRTSSELDVEQA